MKTGERILRNIWTSSSSNGSEGHSFFRFGTSDHSLLIITLALSAFGLIMVYSASYIFAQERYGDGLHYFRKQLAYIGVGIILLMIVRFLNYQLWRKAALPIFLLSCFSVVAVHIPGLRHHAGGATRWINLGFTTIQPVEFAKIALLIYMAEKLSRPGINLNAFGSGFVKQTWPALLLAGLCLTQPDFGSVALILLSAGLVLFAAGVRFRYLLGAILASLPFFYFAIMMVPYRRARLLAFLDPWADPQSAGFQIIQSFIAFYRGGLFGAGLGNSKEKLFYLPEAHNDFILAVIGEELGFIGVFILCVAFSLLIHRSVKIATRADDSFGSILASGIGILLGFTIFLNAGIVLGLLPTKGMNMPFISSGGSATVAALCAVGLLLSISVNKRSNSGVYR